jgi:gliding motility-associated lipoprotein GldD
MKNNRFFCCLLLLTLSITFQSCDEPVYVPKPRGYPRVVYPVKSYQNFSKNYCAFTFEYPVYATIEQDTVFFDGRPKHSCWFDLRIDQFSARVHFSYVPISEKDPFEKLSGDAFTMANEHIIKANYIDEIPINTNNDVQGMAFDLEGPVASPFMFYLSDEKEHYLRGALYFNTKVDPDSLAPVVKFLKEDIRHLINTFKWN